jgi:hypothetical protein
MKIGAMGIAGVVMLLGIAQIPMILEIFTIYWYINMIIILIRGVLRYDSRRRPLV